jgi:hypothetical protein
MIDGLDGARKSDGLRRERSGELRPLGSERAKTTNPDTLRIAFRRFMYLSTCCRIDRFGVSKVSSPIPR